MRAAARRRAFPRTVRVVAWGIFKFLVFVGLLAAGAYLIYGQVSKVERDEIPVPSQVVVPNPPPIQVNPQSPLR